MQSPPAPVSISARTPTICNSGFVPGGSAGFQPQVDEQGRAQLNQKVGGGRAVLALLKPGLRQGRGPV